MTERIERFRSALLAVDAESLRTGMRALPKSASAPLHKAAATPFPALGRLPDPTVALRRVNDVVVLGVLADAVVQECLEATLALLGDDADDPSVEQLRAVRPEITDRFPLPIVRLMFASVAISDAVAADKCDEILVSDLPEPEAQDEMPAAVDTSVATMPHETPDEVREARRARRKSEQEQKRKQQEARARGEQARRDAKRARAATSATSAGDESTPVVHEVSRRDAQLTSEQAKVFDTADDLVGSIVVALVPFDDDGPAQPGPQHKRRPCVVIAASSSDLLVRPCYSEGSMQSRRWQSHPLRDWVAAGLDRATFVEDDATAIHRADAGPPLGLISSEDWNALW